MSKFLFNSVITRSNYFKKKHRRYQFPSSPKTPDLTSNLSQKPNLNPNRHNWKHSIWCFFFLFRWMRIPQLLPSAGSSTIVSISKNSMRSVSLQITSYPRSTLPQQQIKIMGLCFVWGKTLLVIRTSHAPSKLYLLVSN